MSRYNAREFSVPGGDLPVHNYSTTVTLGDGLGVLFDTTTGNTDGVVLPTASGGVVRTYGVIIGNIPPGKEGVVRVAGCAPMTADGAITAGDYVQVSDTTAKLGYAKKVTAASTTIEILGQALATAADGEPVPVLLMKQMNHT